MSNQKLMSQQSQGNQRNVDKDGVFLTENYGGLNTESSPMNMPLTDSPLLMNVEVETSGKLRKRRGSYKLSGSLTEKIEQHVPVRLLDGSILHVYIGATKVFIQPDGHDNTSTMYSKAVFPSSTAYKNTSVTSYVYGDNTFIYLARAGCPPVYLNIYQAFATYTGTAVTIPGQYTQFFRDTTVYANSWLIDVNDVWRAFTTINGTTGAGTLATTPSTNGVGLYVCFNWRWVGETQMRLKEHLEDTIIRTHANRATDTTYELGSRLKQHLLANKLNGERDRGGQYNGTTRWGCGATCVEHVTANNPVNSATALTGILSDLVPQQNATACNLAWWITGGQPVKCGAWSSVSGNAASTDATYLFLKGLTHIQWGGISTTDAGYSVPDVPGAFHVFALDYLPFMGGQGVLSGDLFVRTNNVAQYTVQSGTGTLVDSPNIVCSLNYKTTDSAGSYTIQVPDAATNGSWLGFNRGYVFGILGSAMLATDVKKHSKSWFSADAQEGVYDGIVASVKDGIWGCHWGLSRYMNYYTGSFASVVGTYQDRLIFGGFNTNPGVLAFSNVGTQDETEFGAIQGVTKYRSFDITHSDPELTTSPFEVSLNLDAGEQIKCVLQWYDDLFVGTNRNMFRIHGGDNIAVTPSNYFVSKVGNVGTITNGMTLTDSGIVFIGEAGVYQIVLDINTGAYKVENIGLKIRPEIRKCMDRGRFAASVGRIGYDSTNNVVYVLTGDEYGSLYTRRCFVYFADRESWSEYSMYNGFMNAVTVAFVDGRLFMGIQGATSTITTIGEFNADNVFTDLLSTRTLVDNADIGYDLDVPVATWGRSNYITGSNVVLNFGPALKLNPVTDYNDTLTISDGTTDGVSGTDFWRHKNNTMLVDGTTYWTGTETLTASIVQEEANSHVLNVYSTTDEDWLTTTDLTYTTEMGVRTTNGGDYDNTSVVTSLSYPTWWVSPAFTRNDIKDLKRMHHFYGVFENSLDAGNNTYTAPSWDAQTSFNLSIIQNGTESGQLLADNLASTDIRDLATQSPAWLDFYRVSLPIKGSFISFQACVHSFDRGQWEMVGYQIETDTEGRTSRRAFNE